MSSHDRIVDMKIWTRLHKTNPQITTKAMEDCRGSYAIPGDEIKERMFKSPEAAMRELDALAANSIPHDCAESGCGEWSASR